MQFLAHSTNHIHPILMIHTFSVLKKLPYPRIGPFARTRTRRGQENGGVVVGYTFISCVPCLNIVMNSVLEQQRRLHEERERVEDAILKELLLKKTSVS